MEIKQEDNGKSGSFFLEEDGKKLAEMTYVHAGPGKFIIDHTEVFPGGEGKGLGKILVKAGVEFARAQQLKIIPLCPFAKSVFEKTPDFKDVLA